LTEDEVKEAGEDQSGEHDPEESYLANEEIDEDKEEAVQYDTEESSLAQEEVVEDLEEEGEEDEPENSETDDFTPITTVMLQMDDQENTVDEQDLIESSFAQEEGEEIVAADAHDDLTWPTRRRTSRTPPPRRRRAPARPCCQRRKRCIGNPPPPSYTRPNQPRGKQCHSECVHSGNCICC